MGLPARCALAFFANMTPERDFAARWLQPFSLFAKDTNEKLPATRWTGEFFSFHFLHHRVLKIANHQGREIFPSLTTTPGTGKNGRKVKWATKKQ